jgi:uncharacterized membrane protein YfcA
MGQILLIKGIVILLTVLIIGYFLFTYRADKETLSGVAKFKTICCGFLANFFDTFGIGSFSTYFALRNLLGLMPDNKLYNGSLVIHAVLPTLIQSLLFLHLVHIDLLTLLVSCIMISLGGILSGYLVKFVERKTVSTVMLITFLITLIIVILDQMDWLNIGGEAIQVRGHKLLFLGAIMFAAGCLPAFGVGYYSLVLVAIFLLGLSPAVAYPIMTTASAVQMPMTAAPMVKNQQYYGLTTILLMIAGSVAVLIAAPIISLVDVRYLKIILLVVLFYNIVVLIQVKRKS